MEKNNKSIFAYRLKKIREIKKIRQIDLAKFLNVSQITISNWEAGRQEPSHEKLTSLSKILNVTTDYLMGLDYNTTEAIKIAKMRAVLKKIEFNEYEESKFEIEQEEYYQNYIAETEEAYERQMEELNKEIVLKETNPELYVETKIENAKFKAAKEVGLLYKYYPNRKDIQPLIEQEKIKSFEFRMEHIILDKETLKQIYEIEPIKTK